MNAPEIACGQRQLLLGRAEHRADAFLDHQRGAERQQQAVQRIAAVGAAQRELEQHAERADDDRRERAARSRSARRPGSAFHASSGSHAGSPGGATISSATYMPSAKNEPCARLIVSIRLTTSMNPSAISANSRPSARPLTRWGRSGGQLRASPAAVTGTVPDTLASR